MDLFKQADALPYPALLLDNEYKIIHKNPLCVSKLFPLRLHARMRTYLSPHDIARLKTLSDGETIHIDLQMPWIYAAFAFRILNTICIGLRAITVALQQRVEEITGRQLELTKHFETQLISADVAGTSVLTLHSRRMLRSQTHIFELLRIINGLKRDKLVAYDITQRDVFDISAKSLRAFGVRVFADISQKPLIAIINERDFYMLVSVMICNAVQLSESGVLNILQKSVFGRSVILISTDVSPSLSIKKSINNKNFENESFCGASGGLLLDFLLMKMLCEYYFWDFIASVEGADGNRLCLGFSVPLLEEQPDGVLAQPDSGSLVSGITETEFSVLAAD